MRGNGRQLTSGRIPVSPLVHTKNIRRRGSAITKCCAAVVGRRVRVSLTTPTAISTLPIEGTSGQAFAPALCNRGMRIQIVTPARAGSNYGNRITAVRWAGIFKHLGHRVSITQSYDGKATDLLV